MKYRDETDKCYGVAGMALSLSLFNAADKFTSITIEAENGFDCIQFTPDYYVVYNPSLPAKESWQNTLNNFQLTMALAIADGICRRMVGERKEVDKELRRQLYKMSCEGGRELCQLEEDEVKQLFEEYFTYLAKVFSNKTVRDVVKKIHDHLTTTRTIERGDLLEMLSPLRD